MPKRVHFDQEGQISAKSQRIGDFIPTKSEGKEDDQNPTPSSGSRLSRDNDHTIESDDEEDVKRKDDEYEKLNEDDIEGAEDGDVGDELFRGDRGGAKITPFNLKEEMEEGDFDTDGHYHFKKDQEIRDNWLDNIDWVKVGSKSKGDEWTGNDDSDDDVDDSGFDEIKVIESIVNLLCKGETVTAGLRRLGGGGKKKQNKQWKRSKVYDLEADEEEDTVKSSTEPNETERKADFMQLTELVDQMASAGHYDVYTDTFEKLQYKLCSLRVSKQASSVMPDDDVSDDDALDMFGADLDSKQTSNNGDSKKDTSNGDNKNTEESTSADLDDDDSVRWEYKWSEQDPTVYGPFTSEQMAEWKEKGFFKDTLVVRKLDKASSKEAVFYSARRIDFDLYT